MAVGYLAQVTLPSTTNLPSDDVVNTFAFAFPLGLPETPATLSDMLGSFYNADTGQTAPLSSYISGSIARDRLCTVKIYDLEDAEPRNPVEQGGFLLGNPGSNDPLPNEVALCLSIAAQYESGTSNGRRRGRVYLGPFNSDAIDLDTVSQPRPEPALINDMLGAADRLYQDTEGVWSVWSRADNILYPLVGCAVDNEFDTQRRRGRRPTARSVQVLSL